MRTQIIDLVEALKQSLVAPAASCPRCGGWTSFGGMSQHADTHVPVMGRFGCVCHNRDLAVRIVTRQNVLNNL